MKKLFLLLSLVLSTVGMNAATVDLKTAIDEALKASATAVENNEAIAVLLDANNSYTMTEAIDLADQKVCIYGNGAVVKVSGAGQLTTQTWLMVRNLNVDCAEATDAPFGMSKNPNEALKNGFREGWFYNENEISFYGVNFREVKNSVFTANGKDWALSYFTMKNSIIQIANATSKNIFNFKGGIKALTLDGNTIYSIDPAGCQKSVFYLGSGGNAQPQKVWGDNATAHYVVTNNTMCNLMKNLADQWPSKNNVTVTAKGNIFYNVFRFVNKFVGGCVKDYTVNDNVQFSNLGSSTIESGLGVEIDPNFAVPTEALDFWKIDELKANFGGVLVVGAPRWYNVMTEVVKNEGSASQVINMSNTLQLVSGKYSINDYYPWIIYNNSGSKGEVRRGGIYVSINPTTFVNDGTFTYMVDDAQQWLGTPKVEVGFVKDADDKYLANLISYSLAYNVQDVKKVELLLTGGGSNTNVADVIVLDATNKNVIKTITSEVMPGKSQKNNAANTNSTVVTVNDLDPAKAYIILVAPSLANTTVQQESVDEFGDVVKEWVAVPTEATSFINDINVDGKKITNIKAPAVYVAAVRITGSDDSVAPVCHVPGAKYAGTNYEVFKFANGDAYTTAKKIADGAEKPVFNKETHPWISYVNESSACENGLYEISKGGHYASIHPVTGNPTLGGSYPYPWGDDKADFIYICPDSNPGANYGSPKVEMGNTKLESGDLLLQPKNLSISVKEATRVDLLLSGAGSNTNAADIIIKDAATGKVVKVITTETMAGKSNKDNAANTNSQKVAIDLSPAKRYTISVFPSAKYTQVEMATTDEFGDIVKQYVPFTGDWSKASTYTAAGLSNVKAPAVFVYAAHIYSTDLSTAPGDALGDATGINEVNSAETTVKAKKFVKNGRIVIESANGTYSVTGAQLK